MSRASLRMKNNQPIATDVNGKTLSMIFGLSSATELDGEQGRLENRQNSNEDGVLLINYRRSSSEDGCQGNQGSVESPPHGELVDPNAWNQGLVQCINNKISTTDMVGHLEVDLLEKKPRRKSVFSKSEWSYNINYKQEQLSDVSTILSSTSKENANADFESVFITDEESHPDDSGAESSSLDFSSNGGQVDEKSRSNIIRSSKFIRAKFRDSKSWGKIKSLPEDKEVGGINSVSSSSSSNNNNVASSAENVDGSQLSAIEGKLSRLFFARKSTVGSPPPPTVETKSTPKVAEEEEQMLGGATNPATVGREKPPQLAIAPLGLGPEQLKRRHIIDSLVHSENNYVSSLQRLLNDYKTPLEESSSPILSANKVQTLFHRVAEILQCHTLFRIALSDAINNWDRDEAIGDVFVATFSKAVVLEIYSEFINNFTTAMELARHESKRKSALADFLKIRQIKAHDRVSFFGLMVKPVQRFPQFILLLQDLLKETHPGHPDRMALQLALTTLESLAEMLNERKREAEQYAAFRDKMRSISGGKFSSSGTRAAVLLSSDHHHFGLDHHSSFQSLAPSSNNKLYPEIPPGGNHNSLPPGVGSLHCHQGGTPLRFLLREDNMTQLEFNSFGLIARSKHRRLLLLNDFLVCVSVNGRSLSDLEPPNSAISNERLTMKWAVPVRDVELLDGNSGGTLARMLFSTLNCNGGGESSGGTRKRTLTRTLTPGALLSGIDSGSSVSILGSQRVSGQQGVAEDLAQDMNDLMHDYDVVSKISHLIGTLKGDHEGMNTEVTSRITHEIQKSIRQKDEEMFWADASCLQFTIRGRGSKDKSESFTFQCKDPNVKKEWIVELRLAQLALDPNNSPGWDVLEQERNLSTKMPLFVKSYCGYRSTKNRQSEISCGTSYTIFIQTATRALRPQTYVWFAAHDGVCSHLRIFGLTQHQPGLKEMGTVTAPDQSTINCLQYVPGLHGGVATNDPEPLRGDLVWVGFDAKQIIIYSAMDPDRGTVLGTIGLTSEVVCMKYHLDTVWVGLANGSMAVFKRNSFSLSWQIKFPQLVLLGDDPVTALLPVTNASIYAACGQRVWVVDAITKEQLKSFVVQSRSSRDLPAQEATSQVQQMAQSGVGLWISLKNSATICLYHTETFRHLQDINIASNVSRVLAAREVTQPQRSIHVTALMASRGLLWVGTNVGIALTVPLPRLEGVPIISGRANISYHAHYGPVTFFLNMQHRVKSAEPPELHHNAHNSGETDSMIMEESEQELQSEEGDTESKYSYCLSGSNPCFDGKPKAATDPHKTTKMAHRNDCSLPRTRPRTKQCGECDFDNQKRFSKTLPRGFSLTNTECTNNELTDVYGLYGDLLNVKEYSYVDGREERRHGGTSEGTGSAGEENRKSDPELSTIQYRVSTLDRRMRMKSSRPKSLDMSSTWSMESRGSSSGGQTTTSSSEAGSARPSPCVSRNDSFQSHSSVATSSNSESAVVAGLLTFPVATSVPTPPLPKPPEKSAIPKLEPPKTITTLMGGRGYINWRRASMEKQRTAALAQINNSDAFLVIWEMKI